MPTPPKKPLFEDENDHTAASPPGSLPFAPADDEEDRTTVDPPRGSPSPADDEDDRTTVDPPRPQRR